MNKFNRILTVIIVTTALMGTVVPAAAAAAPSLGTSTAPSGFFGSAWHLCGIAGSALGGLAHSALNYAGSCVSATSAATRSATSGMLTTAGQKIGGAGSVVGALAYRALDNASHHYAAACHASAERIRAIGQGPVGTFACHALDSAKENCASAYQTSAGWLGRAKDRIMVACTPAPKRSSIETFCDRHSLALGISAAVATTLAVYFAYKWYTNRRKRQRFYFTPTAPVQVPHSQKTS